MWIQNKSRVVFKNLSVVFLIVFLLFASLICTAGFLSAAVPSKGVIKITSSGVVIGTDKIRQNGNVYTLTEDIYCDVAMGDVFINIECDGIVFDGAGKTIRGANSGIAIGIYGKNDITIRNIRISDFGTGVEIYSDMLTDANNEVFFVDSSNNTVIDSYFETRYWCIALRGVKNFVSGNTFIARNGNAVEFRTEETVFVNNKFIDCSLSYWEFKESNVISENTINGKPLVFLVGQSDQVIDGVGQVTLINCINMVIQNVDVTGLNKPIELIGVNNSLITHCKGPVTLINSHNNTLIDNEFSKTGGTWQAAAVTLSNSNNNLITQNDIVGINSCGIIVGTIAFGSVIGSSGYNRIERNTISSFSSSGRDNCAGIVLGGYKNYVYENNVTSEEFGLKLGGEYNVFFKNNVSNGRLNIFMEYAMYNDILGNNLSGTSDSAICLSSSDFNNIVWNNFKDNSKVYEVHETYAMTFTNFSYYAEYNRWDNGKEGNYWSDYTGQDTNGDGIGNKPYEVYGNFTDNHPLTKPYDTSKIQITFEQWDGLTIYPQTPSNPQTPSDGEDISKSFPLKTAIAVVSGTIIIVAVGVVFLWRFKKVPETKVV